MSEDLSEYFGLYIKEKYSNFHGIVVAYCVYANGHTSLLVRPNHKESYTQCNDIWINLKDAVIVKMDVQSEI